MRTKQAYYQPLLIFGLCWAFAVTILRTLRWPNDWAEAHWLISYEFGFLKRALPGTLIAPLIDLSQSETQTVLIIKMVSGLIFMTFCALLLWICFRIVSRSQFDISSVLLLLLFFTSPYIVMSAHLNGYYDNIMIIITILSCLLLMQGHVWITAFLMAIAILIHETFFLLGFPSVIFFALMCYARSAPSSRLLPLAVGFLRRYALLLLLPVLSFGGIVLYQALFIEADNMRSELVAYLSRYSFIQTNKNITVPKAFTTSFFDYLSPKFLGRITDIFYMVHILLPLAVMLTYGWYRLKNLPFRKLLFLLLVCISLLPLLMHMIAWDTSRIWTYPLVVPILAIWGMSELSSSGVNSSHSLLFCIYTIIVIVLQLLILTPLLNNWHERFSDELRILLYGPSLLLIPLLLSAHYSLKSRTLT